jgi:hypothetical protein
MKEQIWVLGEGIGSVIKKLVLPEYDMVRMRGLRDAFIALVIADSVIAVASRSKYRSVKLRPRSGGIELECHAKVNRNCGFDATPRMAVPAFARERRDNIVGLKVELAKTYVGRDAQHGAEHSDVEGVFSAEPTTIECVAAPERRDGVEQVKLWRDCCPECVPNVQIMSESGDIDCSHLPERDWLDRLVRC